MSAQGSNGEAAGLVAIVGPVDEGQAARLCQAAHEQMDRGAAVLEVTVSGRVDLSVVEALARLRLLTRRRGIGLRVRDENRQAPSVAGRELRLQALLDFAGLELLADPNDPNDPDDSC